MNYKKISNVLEMSGHNDTNSEIIAIRKFLNGKKSRVHLLGICGVGMAGLAFLLKKKGFNVTGCDQAPNNLAKWLKKNGIPVIPGHDPAHVAGTDWLIRSTAVPNDISELRAAQKSGRKIFRRGLVLAEISSAGNSVCVCGTHGKTTTTAMITQVLEKTGLKPSFCIGGEVYPPKAAPQATKVPAPGDVAGWGTGKNIVLEADESDGTLAFYKPFISVITNIEFDHAEYFRDFHSLKKCFAQMAKGTRGRVVYCFDNKETRKILRGFQNTVSYGFSPGADLQLIKWKDTPRGLAFYLKLNGKPLGEIRLPVPGRHNALNAAAACAVGLELGIPFAGIAGALAEFQPVARRFEKVVENKDLLVISDYAHHPTEIAALLSGARALKRKRWLAVFQPHRYSRTKALGKFFPPAFRGIDELVLCPVYEASETKIAGGTSWDLYEHFRQYDKTPCEARMAKKGRIRTFCACSLKQAWDYLKTRVVADDGILIVGAGSVVKISEWAKKDAGRSLSALTASWRNDLRHLRLSNSSVRFNEPMAQKTTLQVGGSADIYIEAGTPTDLALTVKWAVKNCVPLKTIGAGSNLLVSDLGVRGIIVRLKGAGWQDIRPEGNREIVAGAGVSLQKLVAWTAQHGLTGAEFLTGIPGTIGGAVRMNAGAWGKEIGGIIKWARIMEPNGKIKRTNGSRLGFSYRCCNGIKDGIVLEAALKLKKGKPAAIGRKINQIRKRRKWMQGLRSAGSIFKNPERDPAGRLIEKAGLKGRQIGGAKISERHANIFTTGNGANASDVLALIEITRDLVRIKYGVDLEREIEYLE